MASFKCPVCGMVSFNPNDIAQGYCGACHEWTGDMGEDDESLDNGRTHNIYRDNKIHVLADECATCIFKPHERPVDGKRVAGMVRDTKDDPGATVVCHSTLYNEVQENAICRGWYDRLAHQDPILRLAKAMGVIEEQPVPPKVGFPETGKESS